MKTHSHFSDPQAKSQWDTFIHEFTETYSAPPDNSVSLESLKTGFSYSRFVAQTCIRYCHLAADLLSSQDLIRNYDEGDLSDRFEAVVRLCYRAKPDQSFEKIIKTIPKTEFEKSLRLFRHREMVRIAIRDLDGQADLKTTLEDLTALAKLCIEQALNYLHQHQCIQWGTPVDEQGAEQHLAILGMGKLGANELNFSSDVDLIFTYPNEGKTINGIRTTSNEDYFIRLGRSLIQIIGGKTAEGFVFRVDMRLRPYGESGPLALSFDRMEEYYETQGREWERYALIKARTIAGDIQAGQQLLDNLRPFVFRRYLDYNTFESLRDMKQRISLEVRNKGLEDNIKLGAGGIREIEFFGQMFQLLRGGVQPELQARGIITILKRLVDYGYISAETCHDLHQAYTFLRRAENRIQAYMDQQNHQLPKAQEERQLLALAMGYDDWPGFLNALDQHRKKVHDHFNALLESGSADEKDSDRQGEQVDQLNALWQGVMEEDEACSVLDAAGYNDPTKTFRLIDELKNDPALRSISALGQKRLAQIIPILLKSSSETSDPQLVLQRLFDLIKSICRRTAYLSLLCEYPAAISHLVRLSDSSPWIAALLNRHPALLDELLDPRTLYRPPKREDLDRELQTRLAGISDDDLEHQLETMRIFKQINVLRVAASDITNVLPLMKVSDHLSDIAEVAVKKVVDLSWQHLVAKHGAPTCLLHDRECKQGFAVIAYGKLGGLELGYRSDLDLVFLHAAAPGQTQGGDRPIDNALFFTRLGQRVLHFLSAHTSAGILYEVDMRLRPSGDSGMLVSHIDGFKNYQLDEAWTWEHQALIRARPIAGDTAIQEQFIETRTEVLAQQRNLKKLRDDVAEMRRRLRGANAPKEDTFDIKQGHGGIVDIEFMVQYLILEYAHQYPEITQWTDNVRQLQMLSSHGILDQQTAFGLRRAYLILRAMGHRLKLKDLPTHIDANRFKGLKEHVRRCWGRLFSG